MDLRGDKDSGSCCGSSSDPAASRLVTKTIDLGRDQDNDSCSGSSFDPASKGDANSSSVSSGAAASRPVPKAIDLQGDKDSDSCCGSSFEPAGNGDDVSSDGRPVGAAAAAATAAASAAAAAGESAAAAAKAISPQKSHRRAHAISPQESPRKSPALSVCEDFPPLIDALMMSTSEAASANGDPYSSQRSERLHKDNGNGKKEMFPTASESRPSITGERERERNPQGKVNLPRDVRFCSWLRVGCSSCSARVCCQWHEGNIIGRKRRAKKERNPPSTLLAAQPVTFGVGGRI